MKKTYMKPELEAIKIQTQQMIATSPLGMGAGDKNPATEADAAFFELLNGAVALVVEMI